jgi:uncharacterized protein
MDKNKIRQLHKKYTHGKYMDEWFDIVWTHSNIILEVVDKIVKALEEKNLRVDKDLLRQGVLLHDIGVYSCYDEELNPSPEAPEYIKHGVLGYEILKKEGVEESIARFAMSHTGVGLTVKDIEKGNLPLPKKDMIPVTLEEEILCYADKFHTKYPSFSTFEEQKEQLSRYSEANSVIMERFKIKFGIPDIRDLKEKYDSWNKKTDKFLSELN